MFIGFDGMSGESKVKLFKLLYLAYFNVGFGEPEKTFTI